MIESFSSGQVMSVCHITKRQLFTWMERGLITPSVYQGSKPGEHHRYSFADLVAIRTLVAIHNEGISVQAIRKIADRIRGLGGRSFADCFLVYEAGDVVLRRGEDHVSLYKDPGQTVFRWVISLQPVAREVRAAIEEAKKKSA
jgi:DNA-binding transcriptional MerR regulator